MSPLKRKKLSKIRYQLDKLDNSLIRIIKKRTNLVKKVLDWSYNIKLKDGLTKTYNWISSEMDKEGVNLSRFTKS